MRLRLRWLLAVALGVHPLQALAYPEMERRLTGIGNGLGDIYRIPLRALGIPADR